MLIRRVLLFIYLCIFSVSQLWAQVSNLKGTITDEKGAALAGAVVTIPDLKTGAVSDNSGSYQINNLPAGVFLIQVHMLSFNTVTETVHISGSATIKNFKLSQSVLERNEIVVTGTSLATEQRKSTTPIASVPLTELQENASTNIIDAITKLPGVNQVTTGPAISKPIIRGLGSNRILVISDNVRQEGQQWGDEHGLEIDDYNVSKVEVLKGPASLVYGSDALAGVINIITDEAGHENGTKGSVALNYQTNSGLCAANINISGRKEAINWQVYGTGKASHDYQNKYDGYVFNSRFNNLNWGGSLGLNKHWGYSKLSFSSFSQNLGISEGDRDSATGAFLRMVNDNGVILDVPVDNEDRLTYKLQQPYQHIQHLKLASNSSFYLPNRGRIGLTLAFQQNTRQEFEDVLQPDDPGLFFLLKTGNYDVKYFFPEKKRLQITAGVNGMYQVNENKGIEFLVPDYHLFDAGIYTIARKDFGKWTLSGGLRYDLRSLDVDALYLDSAGERTLNAETATETKFHAFNRQFGNLTGSLGTSYMINDRTTLKFNLASGYRSPNIAELAANGVHEGTIRYEYGNKDLKAENSMQADLGLLYNADHIYINVTLFSNYINNYIYIRKLQSADGNDSIPSVGNEEGYSAFIYDQHNAWLYGGELYIDLHPHPLDWLHFENSISYVKGQFTGSNSDSTSNLPYIPAARWNTELRVQKNKLSKRIKNSYIKIGMDANFSQTDVFSAYGTESSTPGYILVNAGFGFDVFSRKQKHIFSLILAGQNLLDTPYQNHLSRLRYAPVNYSTGRSGIWNMGRNFSIMVRVPLSFG